MDNESNRRFERMKILHSADLHLGVENCGSVAPALPTPPAAHLSVSTATRRYERNMVAGRSPVSMLRFTKPWKRLIMLQLLKTSGRNRSSDWAIGQGKELIPVERR